MSVSRYFFKKYFSISENRLLSPVPRVHGGRVCLSLAMYSFQPERSDEQISYSFATQYSDGMRGTFCAPPN